MLSWSRTYWHRVRWLALHERLLRAAASDQTPRLAHIAAMAVAQAAVVSHTGTLLSTTAVVAQAAAKQALGQHSGALAVDMESYSVGQMAAQRHIPFAVLRTIFDAAHENMSLPVAACTTADGSLRPLPSGRLSRMPPMAIAATAALVVGIPGGRTPFAALAPAFFSPPEPGSMILWHLLPLPEGREKAYVQWRSLV